MVLGKHLLFMVQVAPPLQGKEEHNAAGDENHRVGCDVPETSQNLPAEPCAGLELSEVLRPGPLGDWNLRWKLRI